MSVAVAATGTDLSPPAGAFVKIVRADVFVAESREGSAGCGFVPRCLQISQATQRVVESPFVPTTVAPETLHWQIGDRRGDRGVRVESPVPVQQRVKLQSLLAAISEYGALRAAGQFHPGRVPREFNDEQVL
jgi:hypothetical protein